MDSFFTNLALSTITVESKISNIKFKEKDLIEHLSFKNIPLKNKDKYKDIIKIGCNYGEFITDTYLELTKPKKKSNRGRKKKIKPISTRKVQGNGKYFNSQITFNVLDTINKEKFYHLKLFTNGTIQIPFVCDENIEIIKPIILLIIDYIKDIPNLKILDTQDIEITYIKCIMKNYKFNIIDTNYFIDLHEFKNILLNYKQYQNDSNFLEFNNQEYDYNLLNSLELNLIKSNFERYTGIILKFNTPIEDNLNRLTTVKIFSSGKINIDGSNNTETCIIIKKIICMLIYLNKESVLYTK